MGHTRIKTFAGIAFFATWIFLLIFIKGLTADLPTSIAAHFRDTSGILLLYLNIPLFFIWFGLGFYFGLSCLLITCLYLAISLQGNIDIFPFLTFCIVSFVGYRLKTVFELSMSNLRVETERMHEEGNLLREEMNSAENDIARMRDSSKRISYLKNVIEEYSLTLSKNDILDAIADNSFELFEYANRVLLYLIDTERQELQLVRSRKRGVLPLIKAKKGDMFDRWVLKQKMPLLVEDIHKDFRFSAGEAEQGFKSLISCPLTSEHKILGLLRVDSAQKSGFNQSDLRFLDIIADLSYVSLQNAILYERVQDLAIHDSLTGLYVHKYFTEKLREEVKSTLRNNIDFSLLMLDLDNFKTYNDRYGHTAGDLVLKHVASILKSFSRPGDIVSRYGGEEFILLLLNTEKKYASKVAEEIRRKIEKTPLSLRRVKMAITVSIGVASCPSEAKLAEEFLTLVDSRLYKAKEKGRNRVWAK